MGAAAPVVGKVIASVLVSTVATKVAEKVGLSDSAAALVGVVAGGATYNYMGGGAGVGAIGPAPGAMAGVTDPSGLGPGGQIGAGSTAMAAQAVPGMMSRQMNLTGPSAAPISPAARQPSPAPETGRRTSDQMIKPTSASQSSGGDSWWEKLWNNERTADTLVGAVGGMAQGYMQGKALEEQYDAQYDREDEISDRWKRYDPNNMPRLAYPNKARSGVLTRGMS